MPIVNGTSSSEMLAGGTGDDTLVGFGGDDTLVGGGGIDVFQYTARQFGHDVITDFVPGTDKIDVSALGFGEFSELQPLLHLSGTDTVLQLGYNGDTESIVFKGVAPYQLTAADFLFDVSSTGLSVVGTAGNDVLLGGPGNDTIIGGAGADYLDDGAGSDLFVYTGRGFGQDTIAGLAAGFDRIDLSALGLANFSELKPYLSQSGNNTLISLVYNGVVDSILIEGSLPNEFSNADFVFNAASAGLTVAGTANADVLFGGNGDDTLSGGRGNDELTGGPGSDTFLFDTANFSTDTIRDFTSADRISFTGVPISSFNELLSITSQAGADTLITIPIKGGTESIRLINVQASSLVASEFQFSTTSKFAGANSLLNNFAVNAGGWSSQTLYPRHVADVNGDGFADIVGFGQAGVLVSFGATGGTYSTPSLVVANFGQAFGWTSDNLFHRELADLNGDGRADIIGFGVAGTLVSLAKADGTFNAPISGIANFGANQGWTSQDSFARTVADVNGDGKADLIGFGQAGTLVALGNGDGTFKAPVLGIADFGAAQGWTSDNAFHRTVADVNGDGKADLIGFGQAGVLVSLSNGDGTFATATLGVANFVAAQGWTSQDDFARVLGDVNHDGRADIVGFGAGGTWIAYGKANGTFTDVVSDVSNFGQTQGWTSDSLYHRELADVNHDGQVDIVGFGAAGVLAAFNQGDLFL